jgi:hypothetical protein
VCSFLAGTAGAQDAADAPALLLQYETVASSQYLWRGFVVNGAASLQPALTVGYKGLSFNSWQNFSQVRSGRAWTESDVTIEYSRAIAGFTAAVGYSRYGYPPRKPEEGNRSHEFYAGLSKAGWLNPSLRVYRDVSLGRGYYHYASVGHSHELSRRLALRWTAGLGVNQHQYISQTTIGDADGIVALDIRITKNVTLSPAFTQMVGNRELFGNHNCVSVRMAITN